MQLLWAHEDRPQPRPQQSHLQVRRLDWGNGTNFFLRGSQRVRRIWSVIIVPPWPRAVHSTIAKALTFSKDDLIHLEVIATAATFKDMPKRHLQRPLNSRKPVSINFEAFKRLHCAIIHVVASCPKNVYGTMELTHIFRLSTTTRHAQSDKPTPPWLSSSSASWLYLKKNFFLMHT